MCRCIHIYIYICAMYGYARWPLCRFTIWVCHWPWLSMASMFPQLDRSYCLFTGIMFKHVRKIKHDSSPGITTVSAASFAVHHPISWLWAKHQLLGPLFISHITEVFKLCELFIWPRRNDSQLTIAVLQVEDAVSTARTSGDIFDAL